MTTAGTRLRQAGAALLFAAIGLFIPGCVTSKQAILTESDQIAVPDISGQYVTTTFSRPVDIVHKGNNRFVYTMDDDGHEEEAILVPLENPDTYLLQLHDTRDGDYTLMAILVADGEIHVSGLVPVVQEQMAGAFEETDKFRLAIRKAIQKRFTALQEKHGVLIENGEIINAPSVENVIAFFNGCMLEPNFMATEDILKKRDSGE